MTRLIIATIACALLLGAISFGLVAHDDDTSSPDYLTVPIERGDMVTTVTATGRLEAVVMVKVGSQLSGQIEQLHADFNDVVKRGQPLAVLDQTSFKAMVQKAEAEVEIAKATYVKALASVEKARDDLENSVRQQQVFEAQLHSADANLKRAERLFKDAMKLVKMQAVSKRHAEDAGSELGDFLGKRNAAVAVLKVHEATIRSARTSVKIAQSDAELAKSGVKQKLAALEQSKHDLKRSVIRSPIDGVVIRRSVGVGQTVAASLTAPKLFVIANDLREMEVHARVDEADIGGVNTGQPVSFRVDAFPGETFTGQIIQIRKAPEVEQNVVTYTVVIATKNDKNILLPGMTAIVNITTAERKNILKVPNSALRFQPYPRLDDADTVPSTRAIWLLDGSRSPSKAAVVTGLTDGAHTEVHSYQITAGQMVIIGARAKSVGQRIF